MTNGPRLSECPGTQGERGSDARRLLHGRHTPRPVSSSEPTGLHSRPVSPVLGMSVFTPPGTLWGCQVPSNPVGPPSSSHTSWVPDLLSLPYRRPRPSRHPDPVSPCSPTRKRPQNRRPTLRTPAHPDPHSRTRLGVPRPILRPFRHLHEHVCPHVCVCVCV